MINKIGRFIADLLFPPKCIICKEITDRREMLCSACNAKFSVEQSEMKNGGATMYGSLRCIYTCMYDPRKVDDRVSERMILRMKKTRSRELTDIFARDLARIILRDIYSHKINKNDIVLTFVPRGSVNLQKYGFDHGELLCSEVSRYTGLPMEKMFKRSGGVEQKKMDATDRAANAEDSIVFEWNGSIEGKHVILIDDIITSGATAKYAAECLYRAGCDAVIGAFIAMTVKRSKY